MKSQICLLLIIISVGLINSRRHHKKVREEDPAVTLTAVEEMNIRNKGTFIIGYVDHQDKIGLYNRTHFETDKKDDEGTAVAPAAPAAPAPAAAPAAPAAPAAVAPAPAAEAPKRLRKRDPVKDARDQDIKKTQKLAHNTDTRPINLFNVQKMELPIFCKNQLTAQEKLRLSYSVNRYIDCWVKASGVKDVSGISFLNLPYLNVAQLADYYQCVESKQTTKITPDLYITPDDVKAAPQALFNVIMGGKYMPGQPISWLKFWVFICKNGGEYEDKDWMAVENDTNYSETITETYTTKMQALIKNALALENLRVATKTNSGVVSKKRFAKNQFISIFDKAATKQALKKEFARLDAVKNYRNSFLKKKSQ